MRGARSCAGKAASRISLLAALITFVCCPSPAAAGGASLMVGHLAGVEVGIAGLARDRLESEAGRHGWLRAPAEHCELTLDLATEDRGARAPNVQEVEARARVTALCDGEAFGRSEGVGTGTWTGGAEGSSDSAREAALAVAVGDAVAFAFASLPAPPGDGRR